MKFSSRRTINLMVSTVLEIEKASLRLSDEKVYSCVLIIDNR